MATLSIANSMIPSQEQSRQGMVNPRQFGPNDWRFDVNRDPGYHAAYFPSDQQSDNYRSLNEGHQNVKNGMFMSLTGAEPIYGHMNYPRNPLDQEQTNRPGRAMQLETQQEAQGAPFTQNPARTMFNTPSGYPYTRGIAWYALGLNGIQGQ